MRHGIPFVCHVSWLCSATSHQPALMSTCSSAGPSHVCAAQRASATCSPTSVTPALFFAERRVQPLPTRHQARSVALICLMCFAWSASNIPLQILLRQRLSVVQRQQVRCPHLNPTTNHPDSRVGPHPPHPPPLAAALGLCCSCLYSQNLRRRRSRPDFAAAGWWRRSPAAAKSVLCAGQKCPLSLPQPPKQ